MSKLNNFQGLITAVHNGGGMTYIHDSSGKASLVLLTMDRFQEIAGGFDPGHDDDFNHEHVEIKLTKNSVECAQCHVQVVSTHRHDFRGCNCPAEVFADGGLDYLRRGAKSLDDIIDRSEYEVV